MWWLTIHTMAGCILFFCIPYHWFIHYGNLYSASSRLLPRSASLMTLYLTQVHMSPANHRNWHEGSYYCCYF